MKLFAILAGTLCTLSFIPQIQRVFQKSNSLSPVFLIVYCLGVINWGLFGLTFQPLNWPLVIISVTQMLFVLTIYWKIQQNG